MKKLAIASMAAVLAVAVLGTLAAANDPLIEQGQVSGLVNRLAGIEGDIGENKSLITGETGLREALADRVTAMASDYAETESLVVAILNDDTSPFVFKSAEGEDPTERREQTYTLAHNAGVHVFHACYGDTINIIPSSPQFNNVEVYWTVRPDPTRPHYFDEGQISRPRSWTPWTEADQRPHLWTNDKNGQFSHGTITWRDCGHVKPEPAPTG